MDADSPAGEEGVATDADQWWRASPVKWLEVAGVIAGGLASAVVLVLVIARVMAML